MSDFSDSASSLFAADFATLTAMVQKRIQMEWNYHPGRGLELAGFHLLDYALEFGRLLRIVYRHRLTEALREELTWYAAVFAARGWGHDALVLLLDSWIIAIQGIIKPPECNELTSPLQTLRNDLPHLFDAAQDLPDTTAVTSNLVLVESFLQGDVRGARKIISSMIEPSRSPDRLIIEVILPAMAKIGELWEQNRIEIFQEHLATEAIRSLLAALTALMPPPLQQNGRTALVSCAPGDEHELIPLALSAYLEIRGWLVKNLGGSLPAEQIVCAVGALNPDTLFLTCSMLSRLDEVLEVIEHIRSMPGHCRVVVGGHAAVFAGAVLENKDVLVAYDFEHGHRLALEEP